jgi:hypothetical protein
MAGWLCRRNGRLTKDFVILSARNLMFLVRAMYMPGVSWILLEFSASLLLGVAIPCLGGRDVEVGHDVET